MKPYGVAYVIFSTVDKRLYIGVTRHDPAMRFRDHVYRANHGSKSPLHQAMREFGADKFAWRTMPRPAYSYDDLLKLEKDLIADLCTLNPLGFNVSDGGNCNLEKTDDERLAVSRRFKGQLAPNRRPVIVGGIRFESAHMAAVALGVGDTTIKRRLRSDNWSGYSYSS